MQLAGFIRPIPHGFGYIMLSGKNDKRPAQATG